MIQGEGVIPFDFLRIFARHIEGLEFLPLDMEAKNIMLREVNILEMKSVGY